MNKLSALITELCPNGVEYVPLWSVTIWDKRFNSVDRIKQPTAITYPYLLAADLFAMQQENGDVFLLSTGEQTGWTTEEIAGKYLCTGEVVTMPWGKTRPVADCAKYYRGKFVTADNRIMTSNNTSVLDNKYLYYWFISVGKVVDTFYRGSGIQHPDMAKVLDLQIPLPPLEVQREIVRILDTFTELTAELTARQKQYEYYRDMLLSFGENGGGETGNNINFFLVAEIADTNIGLATTVTKYKANQGVLLIHNSDIQENEIVLKQHEYITEAFAEKNHKKRLQENDVITVHTGDVGTSAVISKEYAGAIGFTTITSRIRNPQKVLPEYFCHYLNSHRCKAEIASMTISDRSNLNQNCFEKLRIPIPPIDEQRRIVTILDHFSTLCTDLTSGLPAEIEARKKQYEYYRDNLLSFTPAD